MHVCTPINGLLYTYVRIRICMYLQECMCMYVLTSRGTEVLRGLRSEGGLKCDEVVPVVGVKV